MTTPRDSALFDLVSPTGPSRFGLPSAGERRAANFGAFGAALGVLVSILLIGGLAWSAATGQAPPSRHPTIFGGSLVLDDYRPLTVIDLATGAVTVQLEGVYAQVGATSYGEVEAVPTSTGTMLVNRVTGSFNMLAKDNYVLGPPTNGISLGPLAHESGAAGFTDGAATYIVRYAPDSTISLVDASTVVAGAEALAAGSHHSVRPLGFTKLGVPAADQPGAAAVSRGALWLLAQQGGKCDLLRVQPATQVGQGLSIGSRANLPAGCADAALESSPATLGLALPGELELLQGDGHTEIIDVPGTAHATQFLPVQGVAGELWFLARMSSGWSVFGAGPNGAITGPVVLKAFGPGAEPVVPAYSDGELYTMDQDQPGQPTLWMVRPGTGSMKPVPGALNYPAAGPTEKASFQGADVLVDGPRVIFNNPDSLLAVVVFTDHSHAPVIVDKSTAVIVSAAGPGDANVKSEKKHTTPPTTPPGPHSKTPSTAPTTLPQPVQPVQPVQQVQPVQPVTEQADCATTAEKPYEPQISSISPSDESALVAWTYHLLTEQDCLPSTWSLTVTALGGGPRPAHPVQVVNGQQQLLFPGLTPGTTYQAVVTAYIGKRSTSSTPVRFTTTAVGPGAPASVTAVANGAGGWLVSWTACSGPGCEVPASSWTVTGSSCGTGFVGVPPRVEVPGSRNSVTINPGDDLGLLGDALSFSVQGVSTLGLVGGPTSSRACTQSWQPPDASDLQLFAAGTPVGQTITAALKVVVIPKTSNEVAFGGDQVTFSYAVGGRNVGPTSSLGVDVPGLDPAKLYRATVTVTPVGHPSAAVTITSPSFGKTLPWPSRLQMHVAGDVEPDPSSGTVVATFHGLPPGSFQAQGKVTCASEVLPVSGALNGDRFASNVDLDQIGGQCNLTLTLHSTLSPDPYGVPSPALTSAFSIGAVPSYRFSITVSEPCGRYCATFDLLITYNGSGEPPGTDWQVTAAGGPICNAGTPIEAAAAFPVTVKWPTTCPTPSVTASWVYLGQAGSAVVGVANLPSLPAPPPPTSAPLPSTTVAPPAPAPTTTTTTAAVAAVPSTTAATVVPATTRSLPPTTTTTTPTTPTTPTTTVPATTTTTTCSPSDCPTTTPPPVSTLPPTSTTLPSATTLPPTTTTLPSVTTLPPTTTTLPSATTLPPTTTVPPATTLPPTSALIVPGPGAGPRGPTGLSPKGAPVARLTQAAARTAGVRAVGMWALIVAMLVVVLAGSLGWGARGALRARRRGYRVSKRTYPLMEATT